MQAVASCSRLSIGTSSGTGGVGSEESAVQSPAVAVCKCGQQCGEYLEDRVFFFDVV